MSAAIVSLLARMEEIVRTVPAVDYRIELRTAGETISVRSVGSPATSSPDPDDDEPRLGLATTRQLLAELTARIEVDGYTGGGGLDYSTVRGRHEHAAAQRAADEVDA